MENGHRRQPKDIYVSAAVAGVSDSHFARRMRLAIKPGFLLLLAAILMGAGCQTAAHLPAETVPPPETHRMRVDAALTVAESKSLTPPPALVSPNGLAVAGSNFFEGYVSSPLLFLDDEKFTSYADFQRRLRSLPKGTTLEWQISDVDIAGAKYPLRKKGEIAAFQEFCLQQGLRLIIHPGG
jgi:hypothetical protein